MMWSYQGIVGAGIARPKYRAGFAPSTIVPMVPLPLREGGFAHYISLVRERELSQEQGYVNDVKHFAEDVQFCVD